jgi:hypothetical protein
MNGNDYPDWVAKYIVHNYGERGVKAYREVKVGKSIIGKNRRIDVLVVCEEQNAAVAIECKYQAVSGTADEKIPYALSDVESMQMDGYIVYSGDGFSSGIIHLLEGSELACRATPKNVDDINDYEKHAGTLELDHILAMKFKWWDLFVANKQPIEV